MPIRHTVRPGECLASIAFERGLLPATVWNHPDNESLRDARDEFVLQPGDVLVVPDTRTKSASVATDATHRFRRRAVPERLRLRLHDATGPRAHVPYQLTACGLVARGQTDADGLLDTWIPPACPAARLVFGDGRVLHLELGHLDPADTDRGARARLRNLGYLRGVEDDRRAALALAAFQQTQGLESTGRLDDATCAALVEAHGC